VPQQQQQRQCLAVARFAASALSPPHPHEKAGIGWAAIIAARSQAIVLGKAIGRYISDLLLIQSQLSCRWPISTQLYPVSVGGATLFYHDFCRLRLSCCGGASMYYPQDGNIHWLIAFIPGVEFDADFAKPTKARSESANLLLIAGDSGGTVAPQKMTIEPLVTY
jgi:hypothetical protein